MRTTMALALMVSLAASAAVFASAGGRSGFSGNPTTNSGATCNVCHAAGASLPIVDIIGPTTIEAGATQPFYVVLAGGPGATGGVNISSGDGVGELAPYNDDLYLLDGELTHVAPQPMSGEATAFPFLFTAPNYDTEVTLYAAGNSTDGNLDLLGDGIAATSLQLTVQNGFEPPPPPPEPAEGEVEATLFATGLSSPVAIANAGDSRLFVVERAGRIRIVDSDGTVRASPFLDIAAQVDDAGGEQGLLGLAFHPDYADNGYFYVYYIRDPGAGPDRSRLSRFSVSADPDVADPDSELVLMEFEQPFPNHNGGDLHFGPFGYLHIASGDGGSGGDPQDNAQSTDTLLGKMLRIDVDTAPTPATGPDCNLVNGAHYSIPADNAYADGPGGAGCDEIFALGARNPWRFSFDAATGAMWIADVGQNTYEEINYLPPGSAGGINLGWRCYEGTEPFNTTGCDLSYLFPVHTYSHAEAGCSVTGGRVYRGRSSEELQGQYFFSDFCQSSIRALSGPPGNPSQRILLPAGVVSAVSAFGEDSEGELYVASINTGRIYRLDPVIPPGC